MERRVIMKQRVTPHSDREAHMHSFRLVPLLCVLLTLYAVAQDVTSGPYNGKPVPVLKVFDATGPNKGKELDYAAERKDTPTVYIFIQADKWDRPMARFLKTLDQTVQKEEETMVVAVWLTEDAEKTKEY